jgi:hypothetical protein
MIIVMNSKYNEKRCDAEEYSNSFQSRKCLSALIHTFISLRLHTILASILIVSEKWSLCHGEEWKRMKIEKCVASINGKGPHMMLWVFKRFDNPCNCHLQVKWPWDGLGSSYIALALGSVLKAKPWLAVQLWNLKMATARFADMLGNPQHSTWPSRKSWTHTRKSKDLDMEISRLGDVWALCVR